MKKPRPAPRPRRRPPKPAPPAMGDKYVAPTGLIRGVSGFTELTVVKINRNGTVNLAETDTAYPHVTLHPFVRPTKLTPVS